MTRPPRGALRHKDPPYRPVTARKGTVAKRALWCFHFLLKTFRSLCLPKDFPTQKKQSSWLWPLPKAPLQLRLGPPCECLRGVQSHCYEGFWGRQRLWTLRVSTYSQWGTGKARKITIAAFSTQRTHKQTGQRPMCATPNCVCLLFLSCLLQWSENHCPITYFYRLRILKHRHDGVLTITGGPCV